MCKKPNSTQLMEQTLFFKFLSYFFLALFLSACGSGGSDDSENEVIETYSFEPPSKITKTEMSYVGGVLQTNEVDYFPTLDITIDLHQNVKRSDTYSYEIEVYVTTDGVWDFENGDFKIVLPSSSDDIHILRKGGTYYKSIYAGKNNVQGNTQFKIRYFDNFTLTEYNNIVNGGFMYYVRVAYYDTWVLDRRKLLSEDFYPENGVFVSDLLNQVDSERDYLGNSALADIKSVNISIDLE